MNQNDKNKLEKFGMTQNELNELRYHYVDRLVDNMSTKDLVQYVFDDMTQYVDNQSDAEEVLSEKILDDLFYPEFDKLASENDVFDEIVADAEEALANESGIKSLNFRS